MNSALKQELIEKIAVTNDDELLQILKADYDYFMKENEADVLDELSQSDREELVNTLKEPFGENTESYEDFKRATNRWRTKSL